MSVQQDLDQSRPSTPSTVYTDCASKLGETQPCKPSQDSETEQAGKSPDAETSLQQDSKESQEELVADPKATEDGESSTQDPTAKMDSEAPKEVPDVQESDISSSASTKIEDEPTISEENASEDVNGKHDTRPTGHKDSTEPAKPSSPKNNTDSQQSKESHDVSPQAEKNPEVPEGRKALPKVGWGQNSEMPTSNEIDPYEYSNDHDDERTRSRYSRRESPDRISRRSRPNHPRPRSPSPERDRRPRDPPTSQGLTPDKRPTDSSTKPKVGVQEQEQTTSHDLKEKIRDILRDWKRKNPTVWGSADVSGKGNKERTLFVAHIVGQGEILFGKSHPSHKTRTLAMQDLLERVQKQGRKPPEKKQRYSIHSGNYGMVAPTREFNGYFIRHPPERVKKG